MESRVSGHALIWMAVTRATCECGRDIRIDPESAAEMTPARVTNFLLDAHSDHLAAVREKRSLDK